MHNVKYDYFLTVSEERSISKAANKLFISQPYLSKVISSMEFDVGTKLFHRNSNSLVLTAAGERYVRYIKDMVQLEDELHVDISEINSKKEERIAVGIADNRGAHILPLILPPFINIFPHAKVTLYEHASPQLLNLLLDRKVDIAFLSLPDYPKEIESEVVKYERVLLVLPPDCHLGEKEAKGNISNPPIISKDKLLELNGMRMITAKKSQGLGMIARRFLVEQKLNKCEVFETSNMDTIHRLTGVGVGFCVMPESMIRNHFDDEPFYYAVDSQTLRWSVALAHNRDEVLTPIRKEFINISRNAITCR